MHELRFSFSSLFIALVMSSILILFLNYILTHSKSYRLFRIDVISILAVLICLRLLFPIELPFIVTVCVGLFMNIMDQLLETPVTDSWTAKNILLFIWLIGSLVSLIRYLSRIHYTGKVYRMIQQHSSHHKVSEFMPVPDKDDYEV